MTTLAWRRESKPWQLENEDSKTEKDCSDERIIGFDAKGRYDPWDLKCEFDWCNNFVL